MLNIKNIKKNIKKANSFLEDKGIDVPHSTQLEYISIILGYKDWNTLIADKNQKIKIPEPLSVRHLHVHIKIDADSLTKLIMDSLEQANCSLTISDSKSNGYKHYYKLDSSKSDNFITALIVFNKKCKQLNIKPDKCFFVREVVEIEDMTSMF